MIKNDLEQKIKEIVKRIWKIGEVEINLTNPPTEEQGDFALGCFELAKSLKQSPQEIGEKIAKAIETKKIDYIKSVQVEGPYVNFKLTNKYFSEQVGQVLQKGDNWGRIDLLAGKLFLVEHTDPNLFKEFHIGHLMTNSIGESLGRIADFAGAKVRQVTFQGDVGLHVAKTLYGMMQLKGKMPGTKSDVWERQSFLGQCYTFGNKQYEENEDAKKDIVKINKNVYSREDDEQNKLYEMGKEWSLAYFEEIYRMVGSKFDHYFLESETFQDGLRLVKENLGTVFQESQGAIIFPGSKYGLHDRVFVNSEGLPTYEAKDLGLFFKKWEKYHPDISLTITDMEQKQYFAVVKKAGGLINREWDERTIHLAHGTLRLQSGKMSSRTGDIIRAKDWISEVAEAVGVKMRSDEKKVAEKVALAAIKYSILKVQAGKNIVYDQEKALSFEGDTGPYLQYTYVRALSVLKKAKQKSGDDQKIDEKNDWEIESVKKVPTVGKIILKFPEVVEQSWQNRSSHHLAGYLHKLAAEFNSFYGQTKILDEDNEDYRYNLYLTEAVAQTIKNGLYLLGIEVVEEM